jgi:3',5'-cyclic AMP phosphodiesterase CpdA
MLLSLCYNIIDFIINIVVMKVLAIVILQILTISISYAGEPFYLTTDVNKALPNAEYAYSFIQITDIHVGEGEGDYGSEGFMDDIAPTDNGGLCAERLMKSVLWINAHHIESNIKFVIVSGDITDSGERSEFEKAKEILDLLEIPYIPLLGNHDAWPYVRYQEESASANGDSVMNVVFSGTYDTLSTFFPDINDTTRTQLTYNPESRRSHYFQNFWYEYEGDYYIFLDFNPRVHVIIAEPGISAAAHLMDFDGGTFPWLLHALSSLPVKRAKNVYITSHHPVSKDFFTIVNGFDPIENDKLSKGVLPYKDKIALWMSGHIHRFEDYIFSTYDGYNICKVVETDANKEWKDGQFRLINVYHSNPISTPVNLDDTKKLGLYPNPASENITIELSNTGQYQLEVFDAEGKLVLSKTDAISMDKNCVLDIRNLHSGCYNIKVTMADMEYILEFVKVY